MIVISSPFGSVNRVGPVADGITKFSNGTLMGIDRESASSRSASLKEWETRPSGGRIALKLLYQRRALRISESWE